MSSSALPTGVLRPPPNVVVFGPRANCTLDICPVQYSVYGYRPSLAANVSFIALNALAALIHTYLGFRWKQWWFMGCMLVGAVNAIIGYVGRVMMYYNPFNFAAFMLQISELPCCSACFSFSQLCPKGAYQLDSSSSLYHYRASLLLRCHLYHPCPLVSFFLSFVQDRSPEYSLPSSS
jgi:hypothetical protein